jgi:GNAT superfamily N-acetyltransferase
MDLRCKQVDPDEVEALYEILAKCGQDMKARLGLGHWTPPYPLEGLRRSAQERQVYAVLDDERLVATFTIGNQAPSHYHSVPGVWEVWDASSEPTIYVNRLAVLPECQGQGIGTWCMHEIERLAQRAGYASIRLDAYDQHKQLVAWYQWLGYHWRGAFKFSTRLYGETGMVCLEKVKADFLRSPM